MLNYDLRSYDLRDYLTNEGVRAGRGITDNNDNKTNSKNII